MKISKDIVNNYISYVTNFWMINNGEEQADDVNEYYDAVMQMKQSIINHGDFEPFRLALDYYLCHPELNLEYDYQGYYGWEDNELKELLKYIRKTVYADASPVNCEEVEDVEIVPTSKFDWWNSRIELQPKHYQEGWEERTGEKLERYNE